MKFSLNIAEDGRILSATYEKFAPADAVFAGELPEGDISNYRYVDGMYVYDPLPELEQPAVPKSDTATWDELAAAYSEGVQSA